MLEICCSHATSRALRALSDVYCDGSAFIFKSYVECSTCLRVRDLDETLFGNLRGVRQSMMQVGRLIILLVRVSLRVEFTTFV